MCSKFANSFRKQCFPFRFTSELTTKSLRLEPRIKLYSCWSATRPNCKRTILSTIRFAKHSPFLRHFARVNDKKYTKSLAFYGTAFALATFAMSYAAVPLYRLYCQATGKGGRAVVADDEDNKVSKMKPNKDRLITVKFSADVSSQMAWNFKPTQIEVKVPPGETVLAFYTAKNPLDIPVNGVATYNVVPWEAGQYLNKIQCFCFEEQRLNPNEEVDMPVFFYFDPEYATDPRLEDIDEVVLSYTFFQTKEGFKFPFLPNSGGSVN